MQHAANLTALDLPLGETFQLKQARDLDLDPKKFDKSPVKGKFSKAYLHGFERTSVRSGEPGRMGEERRYIKKDLELVKTNEVELLNEVILYQRAKVTERGYLKAVLLLYPKPDDSSPDTACVKLTADVDNLRTYSPATPSATYFDTKTKQEHLVPSLMLLRNVTATSSDEAVGTGRKFQWKGPDWLKGTWDVALLWWGDRFEKRWIVCSMNKVLDRYYKYIPSSEGPGRVFQPTNENPPPHRQIFNYGDQRSPSPRRDQQGNRPRGGPPPPYNASAKGYEHYQRPLENGNGPPYWNKNKARMMPDHPVNEYDRGHNNDRRNAVQKATFEVDFEREKDGGEMTGGTTTWARTDWP